MKKLKFIDVTDEKDDVVSIVSKQSGGKNSIKVFENGNTCIIFEWNDTEKHLSISNNIRPIKDSEIRYSVEKIMKVNPKETKMFQGQTGILHIHWQIKQS